MKRLAGAALVLTLVLAGCGGEENQAEKDLDKINNQIGDLENKIKNLKSENDQLEKNIQIKEEELQKLQETERSGQTGGSDTSEDESSEEEDPEP
ncbi:hypothetical protein [Salinicoccus carnicancri]|uniref:hypothetical protein n=1 Tax=Salinicoccus carnicancri TaxID=558170 RepID=UPI0002E7032C|nr:hypothetical protein [Salinicoccus carnicancri]